MEIIHDVLRNQHGDLLGHKYYCIRLHFFNIYSHGLHVAAASQGTRSAAASEAGAAAEGPAATPRRTGHPRDRLLLGGAAGAGPAAANQKYTGAAVAVSGNTGEAHSSAITEAAVFPRPRYGWTALWCSTMDDSCCWGRCSSMYPHACWGDAAAWGAGTSVGVHARAWGAHSNMGGRHRHRSCALAWWG